MDSSAASVCECRATWSGEVSNLALLYVYAPGRTGTAPGESRRQATEPCQAIFDFSEDGTLLGVEVIAEVPGC